MKFHQHYYQNYVFFIFFLPGLFSCFFCRCFKCSLLSFSIHHFFLSHTRDIEWKTFLLKCLTLACRMPLGFFSKWTFIIIAVETRQQWEKFDHREQKRMNSKRSHYPKPLSYECMYVNVLKHEKPVEINKIY